MVACSLCSTTFAAGEKELALLQQHTDAEANFRQAAEKLAADWQTQGKTSQAQQVREWIKPLDPLLIYSPKLPDEPQAKVELDETWAKLRADYADKLYELAKVAARERQLTWAYEWTLETARQNPDHADARRLLGFRQFQGSWRTDYEVQQLQAGKVWHAKFGWMKKDQLDRYLQGERFVNGKWMSAAEEGVMRSDISNGWEIETEHYQIVTNISLEEGVALGQRLEEFYRVWRHVFLQFVVPPSDLNNLFAGRAGSSRKPVQHKVMYFRSRPEYMRYLQHSVPIDLSISSGFYFGDRSTAYFFAGEGSDPSSLIHEATHQLFSEANPEVHRVSSKNQFWLRKRFNFWIVEGVACYMESLGEREGRYSLGGCYNERIQRAMIRLYGDKYYLPLSELVTLNMTNLQGRSDIAVIYGQSAAVVSFLMHGESGKYRDSLVRYLQAVYLGRDTQGSLLQATGAKQAQLDQEFMAYTKELVKRINAPEKPSS